MMRRPNPQEDDEELLRQQEEFNKKIKENKIKPAVVVFSDKKEATREGNTPTSSNGGGITIKANIQELIANTFEAIPTDMKLKNIFEKKRDVKAIPAIKFDNRGFPKAVRRDPDIRPSKGSIFSQHIKRLKQEETPNKSDAKMDIDDIPLVVKEELEDGSISATVSNTLKGKHKLPQESFVLTNSDRKQIHEENVKKLKSMTEEEIKEERDKIIATVDPAIVEYLRSLRRNKQDTFQSRNPTIKEQNEAASVINLEELETPSEVLSTPEAESWLNFNKVEIHKLTWMKSIDIPKVPKDTPFEARFDFEGYLLPYMENDITENTRILYHHGEEAGRPGYSLQELLQLSRSNVMQQKILALNTLANILSLNSTGVYDNVIDVPIEQIFFVLRFCLDDNTPAVLNAAVRAIRNLIYFQLDETCLDNMLAFGVGLVQPILSVDNAIDDDNTVNDQQLVEINLIKCLARTNILVRIRYIITTVRPPLETIVYCIEILIRMARDTEFIANKIFSCGELFSSLVKHFVPHPKITYVDQPYAIPLVQMIKLIRVLSSRSKTITSDLLRKYNLIEIILGYLYEEVFSQNSNGMHLQIESMHYWSTLIHYGLEMGSVSSNEVLLLRFLNYHFQHTENISSTTLVRQSHVAALFILISKIIEKRISLSSKVQVLVEQCVEKWITQFRSFENFMCGRSQIISAVLNCCSEYNKHNNNNDSLNRLVERLLEYDVFSDATKAIESCSLLLKNYEAHKTSSNLKSLEAAAWFTMDHIVPLMQRNSCIPYLYNLSCYILTSQSEQLKLKFLSHPNIQNYLIKLQGTQAYFHIGNWFTRCESFFIMNILKIAKSIQRQLNPTIYYDTAVKCLCVFSCEQKEDMEFLLDNIIFCPQFYPVEVVFENTRISVEWNKELGSSWEFLGDIKKVYAKVLGLTNDLVDLKATLSLDMSIGNVIPIDWIYTPLILLYSNQQHNKNTMPEAEQIEIIKNCLRWILIYETHFPTLAASISPTEKYCRLACLFLGSDTLFLEQDVQDLLERNFKHLMKYEKEFNFKGEISGLTNFEDFYTQLLEQYQGVSYGSKLFGNVILIPLVRRHNLQYRKTLWSEYMGVVQIFNLTPSEAWCELQSFIDPPEEDASLIKCYQRALMSCSIRKNSILYQIAKHQLEESKMDQT